MLLRTTAHTSSNTRNNRLLSSSNSKRQHIPRIPSRMHTRPRRNSNSLTNSSNNWTPIWRCMVPTGLMRMRCRPLCRWAWITACKVWTRLQRTHNALLVVVMNLVDLRASYGHFSARGYVSLRGKDIEPTFRSICRACPFLASDRILSCALMTNLHNPSFYLLQNKQSTRSFVL